MKDQEIQRLERRVRILSKDTTGLKSIRSQSSRPVYVTDTNKKQGNFYERDFTRANVPSPYKARDDSLIGKGLKNTISVHPGRQSVQDIRREARSEVATLEFEFDQNSLSR